MRGIIWFKKDLRITDNPALFHACKQCDDGVIGIYIIDHHMWQQHKISSLQINFILEGIKKLQEDLHALNIPLIIKSIDHTDHIPSYLLSEIDKFQAGKLFFNLEYEVNESKRDQLVIQHCKNHNIDINFYEDQLILPHTFIKTQQGEYFKVFTRFKIEWQKQYHQNPPRFFPKPKAQLKLDVPTSVYSAVTGTLWKAGEKQARIQLKNFIEDKILLYKELRDIPFLDATSKLSPYLATGMISAKECFMTALMANLGEIDTGNQGVLTWLSELIWREFYRHILIYVPRVCMNKAYNLQTEKLPWNYDAKLLQSWKDGRTGFPIVDAAMRQLNSIGWMHNRLRMVVAMFLSKNLFLDWRLGEEYFAEKLIDFDFASNNGGWQWSASTGTDAVPYFRIFNPLSQSQRFDPEGEFIRHYCPELISLDKKMIHAPSMEIARRLNYPLPIIDYKKSREFALKSFKLLR